MSERFTGICRSCGRISVYEPGLRCGACGGNVASMTVGDNGIAEVAEHEFHVPPGIKVSEVQVLRLQPEDVLHVHCGHVVNMTAAQMEHVEQFVKSKLPDGVNVIVSDGRVEMEVVRQESESLDNFAVHSVDLVHKPEECCAAGISWNTATVNPELEPKGVVMTSPTTYRYSGTPARTEDLPSPPKCAGPVNKPVDNSGPIGPVVIDDDIDPVALLEYLKTDPLKLAAHFRSTFDEMYVSESYARQHLDPPCPDCNGTREYQPLTGPVEPCRTCCGSESGWIIVYRNNPGFKGCDEYLRIRDSSMEEMVPMRSDATVFRNRHDAELCAKRNQPTSLAWMPPEVIQA